MIATVVSWIVLAAEPSPCAGSADVLAQLARAEQTVDGIFKDTDASNKRVELLRAVRDANPGDVLANRSYQDALVEVNKDEAVAQEYTALEQAHPADPIFTYLRWRMADGAATADAVKALTATLKTSPSFPWAHLELTERLSYQKQKLAAATHLLAFLSSCPDFFPAYEFAASVLRPAELAKVARTLRTRLATQSTSWALSSYDILWGLEFQAHLRPPAEQEKQVALDVARIRSAIPSPGRRLLEVLKKGASLAGDEASEAAFEAERTRRFSKSANEVSHDIMMAMMTKPPLDPHASTADKRTYWLNMVDLGNTWATRWPDRRVGLQLKLTAQSKLPEVATAEFLRTADALLAIPPDEFGGFELAAAYLRRGVRLEQVPALVDQIIANSANQDAMLQRAAASSPAEKRDELLADIGMNWWVGSALSVEAQARSANLAAARVRVKDMRSKISSESADRSEPFQKARRAHAGLTSASEARVALAENRKADAVALWLTSMAENAGGADEVVDELESTWQSLGGSHETLEMLLHREPTPAASPQSSWAPVNKPVPEFSLTDTQGKVWTRAQLKGKVVFANFWATWCVPCQVEVTHLKELAQRFEDKPVVILALNVDESSELVTPFLRKTPLGVPVLLAGAWATQHDLASTLPHNLVIDAQGVIRAESTGFSAESTRWLDQASRTIEANLR